MYNLGMQTLQARAIYRGRRHALATQNVTEFMRP